jgi:hypothetical protein
MIENSDGKFSNKETQKRFEAALRGARIAGPQHKIVTPKRAKAQRKKAKKKPAK